MSITSRHDDTALPWGTPRALKLVLRCDGRHDQVREETFSAGGLDDWLRAAREAGWQMRVGEDGEVFCKACRRGWVRPVSGAPRQGTLF